MDFPSLIAISPAHLCNPQVPIAALRAGEGGVLDLGICCAKTQRRKAVDQLIRLGRSDIWGLRCDLLGDVSRLHATLEGVAELAPHSIPLLVVAGGPNGEGFAGFAAQCLALARQRARWIAAEVYSPKQALAAQAAGYDGLILKGHEAGGRVGSKSAFLFIQHLRNQLQIPFWVQGGMGLQTAASACLAGAAGVILGEQLWLTRESPISELERSRYSQLDGSETICIGDERGQFRFFARSARERVQELNRNFSTGADWPQAVHAQLFDDSDFGRGSSESLVPLGQEIGMAARLAAKYRTVGGVLKAFRDEIVKCLDLAPKQQALAAGSPWAQAHHTKFPIAQGPMTRVSDVAPFCKSVAESGALPFLALALLRGPAVRSLLTATREGLGERSWGAGMLGFVPGDLRKEQLEALLANPPKFALIAGGRPSQAKELEEAGIPTYLHAPSRGLLETFIRDGARKFVFEGRECGGHVGPQCSFSLWQSAISTLLDADVKNPADFHILFAGGIHDDFSAAMVAAAAAPLVERGIKIGVLMGTAYLFTHEAVQSGAITEEFQRQALVCADTALVESGIGHATRCAITPFVDDFATRKKELLMANAAPEEIRGAMEIFNVGRLRIASKGVSRRSAVVGVASPSENGNGSTHEQREAQIRREIAAELTHDPAELVSVDTETQRQLGMYMIGEVAALRDRVTSAAELHEQVCQGGVETLKNLATQRTKLGDTGNAAIVDVVEPLAIIGMGCMFPDAPNLRAYWQNILNQHDAVREVSPDRWRPEDFFSTDRVARDRLYSKWGAFLGNVVFDPLKYQIPPASLFSIEPVQLLALEVAAEALADAGYDRPDFPRKRTAVIMAAAGTHEQGMRYGIRTLMRQYVPRAAGLTDEQREQVYDSLERQLPEWTEDSFPGILANVIAGRIANRFDLGGSNFTVDAACASSLAALQTAAAQLRSGACDAALVGAADGNNSAFCFMCFAKTHALSPDGRSKSFDASADGIGLGEGVGAIVLKRLRDAERDGDQIYAVIKGIGSSSDGRNGSLTAPASAGQTLALERAYRDSGVSPASVSLIEAHSTGTTVGDRVECEGLIQVLGQAKAAPQSCALGSVKSMIGHTKTAAGLASLIKTALALKHQVLPPTIGVEKPNAVLCDPASPLYVNTESRPWLVAQENEPRRAGVSSFGFGGTNFHTVLEQYTGAFHEQFCVDLNPRPCEIFIWRRSTVGEIAQALEPVLALIHETPACELDQLAAALWNDESQRSRLAGGQANCRLAVVANSVADLGQKLKTAFEQISKSNKVESGAGFYYSDSPAFQPEEVCVLFPGQGSQAPNMLRELVLGHPELHPLFEAADTAVQEILDQPLSRSIYPLPVFEDQDQKSRSAINETRVAQPALAVVDLFCFQLLSRYGIEPAMVAGHSFGEYVALTAAEVISPRELFRLSAFRGQAAHRSGLEGGGAMAAIGASVQVTTAALDELGINAWPANINAPHQTVIGGSVQAIEEAVAKLPSKRISARKLAVSAAFHTPMLAGSAKELGEYLVSTPCAPPKRTVFSNTTADVYPNDADEIRRLLTRHMTEPVRFSDQVLRMHERGARVFIEAGPGSVLTNLTNRILEGKPYTAIAAAPNGQNGWQAWGTMLARLSVLGVAVRLEQWFQHRRLLKCGFNEFAKQERAKQTRRPTDWIVNASIAKPVSGIEQRRPPVAAPTERSTKADEPALGVDGAVSGNGHQGNGAVNRIDSSPPVTPTTPPKSNSVPPATRIRHDAPRTTSPVLNSRASSPQSSSSRLGKNNMSSVAKLPPVHDSNGHAAPAAPGILSEYNHIMSQWLELQIRQAQTSERFLETHEKIVLACLAGSENLPQVLAGAQDRRAVLQAVSIAEADTTGARREYAPQPSVTSRAPRPAAKTLPPRSVAPAGERTTTTSGPPSSKNGDSKHGETPRNAQADEKTANKPSATPAATNSASSHASATDSSPPPTEEFRQELLKAVSERTGYPPEMLREDALLEADLGIDSIKTVEIFGSLTKYHKFMPGSGGFDEEMLSEFAKLKTLGDIIAMYDRGQAGHSQAAPSKQPTASNSIASALTTEWPPVEESLQRLEVTAVAAPIIDGEKKNSLAGTLS
jgi:acyl transferase domain-containing protein/NAD(P)H-dependent flavin oxidoreductase YrpB (nitropropane dioxygenase family)